jgi:hypothetical protein
MVIAVVFMLVLSAKSWTQTVDSGSTSAGIVDGGQETGSNALSGTSGNADSSAAQARTVQRRDMNYPPGYMRREPVLNTPEKTMFHCGAAVNFPTAGSLDERGAMVNYWHDQNLKKLKYQNDGKK